MRDRSERKKRKLKNKKHHDVTLNKDCLKFLRETSKNFFNILWKCKMDCGGIPSLAKARREFSYWIWFSSSFLFPLNFPLRDFHTFLYRHAITILTSLQKPRNIYPEKKPVNMRIG